MDNAVTNDEKLELLRAAIGAEPEFDTGSDDDGELWVVAPAGVDPRGWDAVEIFKDGTRSKPPEPERLSVQHSYHPDFSGRWAWIVEQLDFSRLELTIPEASLRFVVCRGGKLLFE